MCLLTGMSVCRGVFRTSHDCTTTALGVRGTCPVSLSWDMLGHVSRHISNIFRTSALGADRTYYSITVLYFVMEPLEPSVPIQENIETTHF